MVAARSLDTQALPDAGLSKLLTFAVQSDGQVVLIVLISLHSTFEGVYGCRNPRATGFIRALFPVLRLRVAFVWYGITRCHLLHWPRKALIAFPCVFCVINRKRVRFAST